MAQHKWHKEIKAWADGAEVQFKDAHDANVWLDTNEPLWEIADFLEYRIKPQPKEPQYLYVYKLHGTYGLEIKLWDEFTSANGYVGRIKLEEGE